MFMGEWWKVNITRVADYNYHHPTFPEATTFIQLIRLYPVLDDAESSVD